MSILVQALESKDYKPLAAYLSDRQVEPVNKNNVDCPIEGVCGGDWADLLV